MPTSHSAVVIAFVTVALTAGAFPGSSAALDIWRLNTDGTGRTLLPTDDHYRQVPTVSRDGTKVAFECGPDAEICVMNIDGTALTRVTQETSEGDPHIDSEPAFSPDGTKIVFSRMEGPVWAETHIYIVNIDGSGLTRLTGLAGEPPMPYHYQPTFSEPNLSQPTLQVVWSRGGAIWRMNVDGSGKTPVTSGPLESPYFDENPTYSPDGDKIAFERAGGEDQDRDIWIMNPDGSNQQRLTNDGSAGPEDIDPDYSPGGTRIVFSHGGSEADPLSMGIHIMDANGANEFALTAGGWDDSPSFVSEADPDGTSVVFWGRDSDSLPNQLLHQWKPELWYHEQETYKADSAETMTDNYVAGPDGYTNELKHMVGDEPGDDDTVLAAADPSSPADDLWLFYLGPWYESGLAAVGPDDEGDGGDYIDAANSTSEDASRMHELDQYRHRIYGRVAEDDQGKTWLQYWFFYYYNEGTLGFGDHEADWEMIQIGLDAQHQPDVATYAQHGGGDQESCPWELVPRAGSGPIAPPIVYVDRGTHASLFQGLLSHEEGEHVRPRMSQIDGSEPWVNWPGRWGGSVDSTIRSPAHQGAKWSDPDVFNDDAGPCPVEPQSPRGATEAPHRILVAPAVQARRVGDHVAVRYRLRKQAAGSPQPVSIYTTVHATRSRGLPTGGSYRLRKPSGRLPIPLPRGQGPYVARVTVDAKKGASSPVLTVPVG
jgi:Tol biopolymer transport system component